MMIGNTGAPRDVFIQDQTSVLFQQYPMTEDKTDITLTANVSIGDDIINVSAGHGIIAGTTLFLYTPDYFYQLKAKSVNVNAITMENPIYLPFPSATTTIIRGTIDLNIDGTTPKTFSFKMRSTNIIPIDINAVLFSFACASQPDDGKFGDLTALTNGFYIQLGIDSQFFPLGLYKKNGDFKLLNGEINYTDSALPPSGQYGVDVKFTFNGQENFGQVIRMFPGYSFELMVQDDLTGLDSFNCSLIGSYTEGE